MMKKKIELKDYTIREMINEINKLTHSLTEAYVYEDEIESSAIEDTLPQEDDCCMSEAPQDDRIAQIRTLALEGMQEFAHDVDNECYTFYKKVFLETDKLFSNKAKVNNFE